MHTESSPSPSHRNPPARWGFSLVELLVVVAVLGVLIAVLIPSLGMMAHQGRVAEDTSNLRSLQMAHYQYAVDSKGQFADAGMAHGGLANESIAWLNLIGEYVDINGVVRSPLDESPHWTIPVQGTTNRYRRTSYGWNNYLSRTHSPDAAVDRSLAADRLSRVKNASSTVHFLHMVGTGSFAGADHVHVENWWINDSLPDAPAILASNQVNTSIVSGEPKTKSARANYGFVDGHVETLSFIEVFTGPDRNRFDPNVAGRSF